MGVREYAAALQLSPTSLRKWRDRLMDGEVETDWRAHLHPSARPAVSTSAKGSAPESSLTEPPEAPERPVRQYFSDADKRAIVAETEARGSASRRSRDGTGSSPASCSVARTARRGT